MVDPTIRVIEVIDQGGMMVLALFVLFFAAIALHRRWIVPGWVYTDKATDHDRLKESERESNEVKREMVAALSGLTEEVGHMRRDIHDVRRDMQEVRREVGR